MVYKMFENQYKIKTGDAMQDKASPVYDSIKAIPHKDCRADAQRGLRVVLL